MVIKATLGAAIVDCRTYVTHLSVYTNTIYILSHTRTRLN